jgi:FkbM family methyltransferase
VVWSGTAMRARDELERLLSESPSTARARAASAFDEIAGGADTPLVLFGAGGLGKRTADALAKLGRPAIAFADGNPVRAGTTFAGLPVLSTDDAVARYGDDSVFVVTVWRAPATERMSERIEQLRARGARRVTAFAALGWKYPEAFLPYYAIDLPHRVLEQRDDVVRGFDLLADEHSRDHFVAHLRLRLHLDFAGLLEPDTEPEYFAPDVYTVSERERFVDCGAYDGDTLRSFLAQLPRFDGRAASFEPDPSSFARLAQWLDAQPQTLRERIAIHRAGIGARRERVAFAEGGGTGSAVGSSGGDTIEVVPLDEAVAELRPTLIKVDVEGYEPAVLDGARRLISSEAPVLALCVYHRQDHPWRIPLTVAGMHDGYRYTLRNYCLDGWDLTLYAVPEARRIR